MIDIKTKDKIIYTTVSGKLTSEEVNRQFDTVISLIKDWDKIRWYYEMNDFEGWTISAFPKDVMESLHYARRFEKIAMIGENKWQHLMSQVSKVFTTAEVRYFDLSQRDEAKQWIEQQS
jgi:hypothetical protein